MASRIVALLNRRRSTDPERAPIHLRRSRVYILPTRFGVMFMLVVAVMLVGSINYNNNLGLIFTFLLIGLALVTVLHTHRNLVGLTIRSGHARAVFAGGSAVFPLHIYATKPPDRCAVAIRAGEQLPVLQAVSAAPGMVSTALLRVPAPARGTLALGRCTIDSDYPLGLFRAWAWIMPDAACVVYPRPEPGAVPPAPLIAADASMSQRGQAGREDFQGLRSYRPGDSPRHLAWKHTAVDPTPYAKQFEGGTGGEGWLDWDQLPHMDPEARLSRLCRWVLDCHAAGYRYGLRLPGVSLSPSTGEHHKQRCLEAMARMELPQTVVGGQ